MAKPRIFFDHDGRHPLIYMYEPPMQKEELEAAVDELVGTPVEALSLTLGDAQSLLYDSQVGALWGRDIKKWPHLIWKRANQNFTQLIKAGCDPLQVLCDKAHANGLLLYAMLLPQQGAAGADVEKLGKSALRRRRAARPAAVGDRQQGRCGRGVAGVSRVGLRL